MNDFSSGRIVLCKRHASWAGLCYPFIELAFNVLYVNQFCIYYLSDTSTYDSPELFKVYITIFLMYVNCYRSASPS